MPCLHLILPTEVIRKPKKEIDNLLNLILKMCIVHQVYVKPYGDRTLWEIDNELVTNSDHKRLFVTCEMKMI